MTREDCKRALDWLLVCVLALMLLGWRPASAHDIYMDWRQPSNGASCCDNRDCRPTRAEIREDAWWAIVDGEWRRVPAEAVLKGPSPDGRSHICASDISRIIFCFMPGEVRS